MTNFMKIIDFLWEQKTTIFVCFLVVTIIELFMAFMYTEAVAGWVLSNAILALVFVFIEKWKKVGDKT